ncbi:hypothetical protein [Streptomyces azureus]|uniref:Uncharacterized protein n=1 Tax=Streptomyces azureus TaxID=146537 RepID=A0A0K8PGR6_STRAJ|nr:hypothetical protein [Streptomyces azureus]GAP46903.1 uncharacterized protein SAZU_1640 [Streptomyces azureus]
MTAERDLLEAVVEALTLPHGSDDYDQRILRRASLARVVAREALAEDRGRLAWNADYLRRKLREEEARHPQG